MLRRVVLLCYLCLGSASALHAQEASGPAAFADAVLPLIEANCLDCHDAAGQAAGLDLERYTTQSEVIADYRVWEIVLARVQSGEMPPPEDGYSLDEADRAKITDWIRAMLRSEAERNAGDPGPVLARRLSNAEYDHCIRDLTGVDIRPTQTFPVDPANEAGFDNSGESLAMSPALMNKYLEAARLVSEHLVLTPDELRFAPHPVITDTDRDKYCVKRIVEFYYRQPTDYADYFVALWKLRRVHPGEVDAPHLTAAATAAEISPRYLSALHDALQNPHTLGPMAEVQRRFSELLAVTDLADAQRRSSELRDWIGERRRFFEPHFDNLHIDGIHKGAQSFVLWKNRQYASHRRHAADEKIEAAWQQQIERSSTELTATDQQAFDASVRAFCDIFPDAFYVSERGRDYLGKPREQQEKGRLLSAGFHSMMGYFRDDQPLCELLLSEAEVAQLDRLWNELNFIASAPQRQYQGFLWFERTDSSYMRDPEFDFARPENLDALTEANIQKLSEVYLAKARRNGGEGVPIAAIEHFFREINASIREVEAARREAQPHHLRDLLELARRAYRRPLSPAQQADIRDFYHSLREDQELGHEQAIRDTLVMILVSPHFSYRVDLLSDSDQPRPLDDFELASRLSFFLWSSLPDERLLRLAEEGKLSQPAVLRAETRRMLRDPKVRGLATEFAANWLDVRRFEEHNSVDRERFPEFDDALRTAMFEEPLRFLVDAIRRDASVLELLYADHTFVNGPLARHYGIDSLKSLGDDQWRRVDAASRFHRGGLLPMAVFLTKNAPGLRTSPVKRGYWVVRRLLGEHIPPPPPDVPELPSNEAELGDLTLREALAKHRDHESCAGCHDRFDSLGLVFESYGPIGEWRSEDLGGRPVETRAQFPDNSWRDSLDDLKDYIRQQRQAEFLDNVSRKLLTFALGRSLLLSDEPLIAELRQRGEANAFRFQGLVEQIVTSRQFLHKRGRQHDALARATAEETP